MKTPRSFGTSLSSAANSALYPSRRPEIDSIDVRTSNNADITITGKTIKSTCSLTRMPFIQTCSGASKVRDHVSETCCLKIRNNVAFFSTSQTNLFLFQGTQLQSGLLPELSDGRFLYYVSAYFSVTKEVYIKV